MEQTDGACIAGWELLSKPLICSGQSPGTEVCVPCGHCTCLVVVLTNKSASPDEELGRAGRCSYLVGTPKNQFEVPALLLGSGSGFGPRVWMSFGATRELKASSERQSGKLVVRLFFFAKTLQLFTLPVGLPGVTRRRSSPGQSGSGDCCSSWAWRPWAAGPCNRPAIVWWPQGPRGASVPPRQGVGRAGQGAPAAWSNTGAFSHTM